MNTASDPPEGPLQFDIYADISEHPLWHTEPTSELFAKIGSIVVSISAVKSFLREICKEELGIVALRSTIAYLSNMRSSCLCVGLLMFPCFRLFAIQQNCSKGLQNSPNSEKQF